MIVQSGGMSNFETVIDQLLLSDSEVHDSHIIFEEPEINVPYVLEKKSTRDYLRDGYLWKYSRSHVLK